MLVRNATQEQIEAAAAEVGVRLRGGGYTGIVERQTRRHGPEFRFTLRTGEAPPWQRLSQLARYSRARGHEGEAYNPVVPGAVCWHGHREFFRALYRHAPDAWIRTAIATYTSAAQFEATHRATLDNPHASGWDGADRDPRYGSLPYEQACTCSTVVRAERGAA